MERGLTMKALAYVAGAALVVGFITVGCGKKEEATQRTVESVIAQKTCPVLADNPIDKNIFVEYKGERVYFCCEDCSAKFEKEPEKYLSKLDTWCTTHDTFKSKCGCKP